MSTTNSSVKYQNELVMYVLVNNEFKGRLSIVYRFRAKQNLKSSRLMGEFAISKQGCVLCSSSLVTTSKV